MNVAVFLPNWIGDAVMATPALRALRNHFPDGEIVGVCKPYVAGVLEGGDWFDHLLLANDGTWKRGILATARQLRQRKCDLAILFPNTLRSAMTAWMGGCRRIVGYARYGRSALLTDAVPPRRTADGKSYEVSPVLDAYNRLVEIAGCSDPGHDLQLFTTPADEASADEIWNGAPWNSGEEVVCLNTGGAFGASKNWPRASFVELAQRLVRERGCGVLIVCGPAEKAESQAIAEQSGLSRVASLGTLADRAGLRLSLGLTKACIRRSSLLVTTDSGPRHFAHAFDRPVVTLFGPTHIGWTETYHSRAIHLQEKVECGPCQKRVCPLDHRCMTQLLPETVFNAATTLLSGSRTLSLVGNQSWK